MKIIYFIDHLRGDGTQHVLEQLVSGLAARGHAQSVVCLNDSWDEDMVTRLSAGSRVRIIGKAALLSGVGLVSVFSLLRREDFDVAVTFLFYSDVIGRLLAKLAGTRRIVSSVQTRNVDYNVAKRLLIRQTVRWADHIHLCSNALREFVVEVEGADPGKIVVIPHSTRIEEQSLPADSCAIRSEFGIAQEAVLLGSVGRLFPQKGFDILTQSLAMMDREDICLLIAGTGEEESRLRELAASLRISDKIRFAGYRQDVPNILAALDVYVQPSRFEGMPLAVLEAMTAARPIVATAVDGICELIEDGVHGWLVPPEDPGSLAEAISEALANPAAAQRRGQAARDRVLRQFNLKNMILAWEDLLTNGVNGGK